MADDSNELCAIASLRSGSGYSHGAASRWTTRQASVRAPAAEEGVLKIDVNIKEQTTYPGNKNSQAMGTKIL